MPLTRLKNGIRLEVSAEDEATILAEWAAERAKSAPVPAEVTSLQLYDEMDQTHGIHLEDAVGAMNPKAAKRYRLANTIRRTDPMVAALRQNMGWTDAQVDALFRAAAART
jgi:hypothetical protein